MLGHQGPGGLGSRNESGMRMRMEGGFWSKQGSGEPLGTLLPLGLPSCKTHAPDKTEPHGVRQKCSQDEMCECSHEFQRERARRDVGQLRDSSTAKRCLVPAPPSPSFPPHLAFAALAASLTRFNFQRSERRGKEGAK